MYIRNCPDCNKILEYTQKFSADDAERKGRKCMPCAKNGSIPWNKGIFNGKYIICKSNSCNVKFYVEPGILNNENRGFFCSRKCAMMGENNRQYGKPGTMFGKNHSEETKQKMRESQPDRSGKNHPMYGKHTSIESNIKRSKKMSGKNHWNYGGKYYGPKKHSVKSKQKMSLLAIERIENGNWAPPNYNPLACKIIDEYGKNYGYNFQHALNGGEFNVPGTRYFVDGYDKDKNVVIEYYEKYHKRQIEYDKQRKQKIINHLGCEFIELEEKSFAFFHIFHS